MLLAKASLMPVPRRSMTAPGLRGPNRGGRACSRARDRLLPPSVQDIKLMAGRLPALRTCSVGQVGRGFQNLVVLKNLGRARIQKNCVRSLALQMNPAGCPKDQAPRIRVFRKTRKGAPTSWVGTPRAVYLERKNVLAKGSSRFPRGFFWVFAGFLPSKLRFGAHPPAKRARWRDPNGICRGAILAESTEQARRLYFDPGPHSGRDGHPVDEMPLGTRRLGFLNGVRECLDVFHQLVRVE